MEEGKVISGVVHGNPPSKSNTYKIVTIGGHGSLAKTKAMKDYEEKVYWEVGEARGMMIDVPFEIYLDVYFPSNRSDLDNVLKGFIDSLAKAGVIKNDNKCSLIFARKFIDRKEPRIEFKIKTAL